MSQQLRPLLPVAIVATCGLVQLHLLALLWGRLWQFSPVLRWLLDNLAGSAWFYPLLWLHDLLINVFLCLPLALLVYRLSHRNYTLLLIAAILPAFIYFNWPLSDESGAAVAQQLAASVIQLAMVPLALLLVIRIGQRRNG